MYIIYLSRHANHIPTCKGAPKRHRRRGAAASVHYIFMYPSLKLKLMCVCVCVCVCGVCVCAGRRKKWSEGALVPPASLKIPLFYHFQPFCPYFYQFWTCPFCHLSSGTPVWVRVCVCVLKISLDHLVDWSDDVPAQLIGSMKVHQFISPYKLLQKNETLDPIFTMKLTSEQVVLIKFFSLLGVIFHLS